MVLTRGQPESFVKWLVYHGSSVFYCRCKKCTMSPHHSNTSRSYTLCPEKAPSRTFSGHCGTSRRLVAALVTAECAGEAVPLPPVRALQRLRVSPSEIQPGCQRQDHPQEGDQDQVPRPQRRRRGRVLCAVRGLHQHPAALGARADRGRGGDHPAAAAGDPVLRVQLAHTQDPVTHQVRHTIM